MGEGCNVAGVASGHIESVHGMGGGCDENAYS